MHINDTNFEEYIEQLEQRLQELDLEKSILEKDLLAAKNVLTKFSYFKSNGILNSLQDTSIDSELERKFTGLSVKECLKIIAKENDGILEVSNAREILSKAGITPKNVSADIARSEDLFEKTDKRGVYRLKLVSTKNAHDDLFDFDIDDECPF
jgi:hypothetical protein